MICSIESLLRHPKIWCAGAAKKVEKTTTLCTGFPLLNEQLPQGGWPVGALIEIVNQGLGVGELRLLMPALSRLTRMGRWVTWVAPPYVPYAPALKQQGIDLSRIMIVNSNNQIEHMWASEQILREKLSGAVLMWSYPRNGQKLRRLQLAAEHSGAWGILFTDPTQPSQNAPVSLRLQVNAIAKGIEIEILKCRGGHSNKKIKILENH